MVVFMIKKKLYILNFTLGSMKINLKYLEVFLLVILSKISMKKTLISLIKKF